MRSGPRCAMPWIFWNPRKPTNAAAMAASVVDPIIRLLARAFISKSGCDALRHRWIVPAKPNGRKADAVGRWHHHPFAWRRRIEIASHDSHAIFGSGESDRQAFRLPIAWNLTPQLALQ